MNGKMKQNQPQIRSKAWACQKHKTQNRRKMGITLFSRQKQIKSRWRIGGELSLYNISNSLSATSHENLSLSYDIGEILSNGDQAKIDSIDSTCKVLETIEDNERYRILTSRLQLKSRYHFPVTKQHVCNRRCKLDYLDRNFHYSPFADAVYPNIKEDLGITTLQWSGYPE